MKTNTQNATADFSPTQSQYELSKHSAFELPELDSGYAGEGLKIERSDRVKQCNKIILSSKIH